MRFSSRVRNAHADLLILATCEIVYRVRCAHPTPALWLVGRKCEASSDGRLQLRFDFTDN